MNLADLIPQRKSDPSWPPAPTIDEATGLQVAWERCDCGEWYMKSRSRRLHINSGFCQRCEGEEALRRKAKQMLSRDAVVLRVEQKLSATAKDRQQRVDAELQRLVEAERPRIAGELEWQDSQRFGAEAEAEEMAEIIQDLQAKGEGSN
jgi:hypothetical protein